MTIKVQVNNDLFQSKSPNIRYGIVTEAIDVKSFNMFQKNEPFDAEAIAKVMVPFETLIKYDIRAVVASESHNIEYEDPETKEINDVSASIDYILLGHFILEIIEVEGVKTAEIC